MSISLTEKHIRVTSFFATETAIRAGTTSRHGESLIGTFGWQNQLIHIRRNDIADLGNSRPHIDAEREAYRAAGSNALQFFRQE